MRGHANCNELARDGIDAERWIRFHPESEPGKPYVTQLLEGRQGPAIVATVYIRAYPEQICGFVSMRYAVLGTDGFGRSDTRENLRRHFEVDRNHIAHAADGKMSGKDVARAVKLYKIDGEKRNPLAREGRPFGKRLKPIWPQKNAVQFLSMQAS